MINEASLPDLLRDLLIKSLKIDLLLTAEDNLEC